MSTYEVLSTARRVRGWTHARSGLLGVTAVVLCLPAGIPAPASAQETIEEVVVTATRIPSRIEDVGSSVTVIDRETIERRQIMTVNEALRTVPGMHMVQSGPTGQVSSAFTRGANSNQTLVLMDGRRISDPSTPTGAFDFAHLRTDTIERIEVVRGPQSALYGSDAIGGVVNIITRRPDRDEIGGRVRAEGGTFGTFDGMGNINGRVGRTGFDVTVSGVTTRGDTVTPDRLRPEGVSKERNGYDNITGSARLDIDLTDSLSLNLFGQAMDTRVDLDTLPEDPNSEEETRQLYSSAELAGDFWQGRYRPSLSVSYSEFRRDNLDLPDARSLTFQDTRNEGDRVQAELRNEIDVHRDHTLILGGEFYEDSFESSGFTDFGGGFVIDQQSDARARNGAVYAQDVFHFGERVSGTAGVRYDMPEDFDDRATWHVAPTYRVLETGTRFKGSVGTGFKIPSLFERFGFNPTSFGTAFEGNPDLDPEKSFGWEVGFDQSLFRDRLSFGATYFESDIEDAVVTVFDGGFSTSANNVDIDVYGVETFLAVTPIDQVQLRADYTFLRADDADTGQQVNRRPKHKASVDATWLPTSALTLSGGMLFVAGQNDIDFETAEVTRLPSYAVFRAAASYRIAEGVEITSRVENLFDRDYEVADGFKAPGIEAFVGTRLTF